MSALGQKQTFAPHKVMSALPSIATAIADSRSSRCLLYPQKRTCAAQPAMSAMGQERTFRHSFDHLVRAGEQCLWDGEPKRFSGLEIDH
jgi:hypothetical protein